MTKYFVGMKVGKLTLLEKLPGYRWKVKCDCGNLDECGVAKFAKPERAYCSACGVVVKQEHMRKLGEARKGTINTSPTFIDKSGTSFGKWSVLKYLGKQSYLCKCNVCNDTQILISQVVNIETDTRCYSCKPKPKLDMSIAELTELFEEQGSVANLARVLGLTHTYTNNLLTKYGIIKDTSVDFEFDFSEISEMMDLPLYEVMRLFRSAMRKITVQCGELKVIEEFNTVLVK